MDNNERIETLSKLTDSMNEVISDAESCPNAGRKTRLMNQANKIFNIIDSLSMIWALDVPDEARRAGETLTSYFN